VTGYLTDYTWLLVALPLAGAVILLFGGRRTDAWGHWLGCATALGAFGVGLSLLSDLLGHAAVSHVDAALSQVRECKFYADEATTATQQRVRLFPALTAVAVTDEGKFDTMRTLAPPAGRGYEYLTGTGWDFEAELAELPARRVFTSMMVPAERSQVALAGPAALVVGDVVVQVAAGGRPSASGRGTGGSAGPDQVLEAAAGLVARLLATMIAGVLAQRGDRQLESAGGQIGQGARSGEAAMADGPAARAGQGHAAA